MDRRQVSDDLLVLDAQQHLEHSREAVDALDHWVGELITWARLLHACFDRGGKLLCAGNGGSAALAAHLVAELVGRYRMERRPFAAFNLSGDVATLTAVANDYGYATTMARQVAGCARPGDVVVLMSTSGASANCIAAVGAAGETGATVLALTGPAPNPLADLADRAVAVSGPTTAAVQEAHQVAVHLLCDAFDRMVRP